MNPGDEVVLDLPEHHHKRATFIRWVHEEDSILVESTTNKERFITHYKSVTDVIKRKKDK